MVNKIYPYTTPANYTYDSDKIEVSGDLAKLKTTLDYDGLVGYWKFEDNFLDSSGNGNNLTVVGNPTFITGKIDKCLNLDITSYVKSTNIQSFDRLDNYAFGFWTNYTGVTSSGRCLLTLRTTVGRHPGSIHIAQNSNKIIADTWNGSSGCDVTSTISINDGNWHYIFFNHHSNSTFDFYIDNILMGTSAFESISTKNNEQITIGNDIHLYRYFNGKIDEVFVYNRALTPSEIESIYNTGTGRHLYKYSTDKPTIKPSTSWDIIGLNQFSGFTESLGGGNQGDIAYQLSDDDGVSWKYWNGSAWVVATTQYNDVGTVHANIDTFPIANEKILFRAFLISDGEQQCELDANEITAIMGYPPVVYAGADKICNDHETKKPFSDATISDPDGDIEQASAWYDIEASGWINIPKGGYGTLQEAIRNFQYTYDNIGTVNCKLKIIDQDSKETIDDMNMNVHKYDVLFNIKDTGGDHLAGVSCNFGDGQGWQILNSPFHYYFDWKAIPYSSTFSKTGFIDQHVDVPSTNHTEDITMQEMGSVDPAVIADAVWDELRSGHTQGGSYGNAIQEKLVDIKSETDKIQTDILDKKGEYKANVTNLDVAVSTRAKETGGKIDDIKTETDKIQGVKNKTDNLPVDPSSETNATANKDAIIGEVNANETKLDNIDGFIKRLLGLNLENFRLFDMIYDANTNLLSGTIKVYANKADCDNDVNPLAIYSITATYNANATLATYKVVKSP